MEFFKNADGKKVVLDLVQVIHNNAAYLSEIDGAIGDGDHGINMDKGFMKTRKVLNDRQVTLTQGLNELGEILLVEIGGAMGPLYGTFFLEMASASNGKENIDKKVFGDMLSSALTAIQELGNAKQGDKTMLDTLIPATQVYESAVEAGKSFTDALSLMRDAAYKGKESTRDMVARIGRSSRLGERSRGILDAGATSCYLILESLSHSIQALLA